VTQLAIVDAAAPRYWRQVDKFDRRAVELADRHYSRQSVGSWQFMPPGRTLVLLAEQWTHGGDARGVWGVVENLDPVGNVRFRCSIFRNETAWLSSDLVREATTLTIDRWRRRFGWAGIPALQTEVDPRAVRRKRDPGRCFRKAGWRLVEERRGLVVLEAPRD
jgi:hypothetical protein